MDKENVVCIPSESFIEPFARKWIEAKIIMVSKINQTHKNKYHIFSHMWNSA
jgi:hypothetical protein